MYRRSMENLKPFVKGKVCNVKGFTSNPTNAPKIESITIGKRGTILMVHINGEVFGYYLTE